ncbi:MAG: dTDP-4-dehydrorhamnose 3,5-epimerase [bacterium]|nr:dTDP-4-dehydrorhamnose 3,5-epimerase [bacterium]
MAFIFKRLDEIPDLIVIEPKAFEDDRGWFMETYKKGEFEQNGIPQTFLQASESFSLKRGTLRGLHFQNEPHSQGKLVRCLAGEVYDVAVDIRRGSPTYGKWQGVRLSPKNRKLFWLPPGFAHGFCTLSDNAEFEYMMTNEWAPSHERGILWSDPDIAIKWPVDFPILSKKDAEAPLLRDSDHNFVFSRPSP